MRVSPFDSAGRRQTSFASCDVMPEIEDDTEIEIKPDDIRIDTYRASGAGGQHINKTSSAIRITHFLRGLWYPVRRREASLPIRIRHSKC